MCYCVYTLPTEGDVLLCEEGDQQDVTWTRDLPKNFNVKYNDDYKECLWLQGMFMITRDIWNEHLLRL